MRCPINTDSGDRQLLQRVPGTQVDPGGDAPVRTVGTGDVSCAGLSRALIRHAVFDQYRQRGQVTFTAGTGNPGRPRRRCTGKDSGDRRRILSGCRHRWRSVVWLRREWIHLDWAALDLISLSPFSNRSTVHAELDCVVWDYPPQWRAEAWTNYSRRRIGR